MYLTNNLLYFFFLQQFKSVFSFPFQFKPIFSSLDLSAGCVFMDLQKNSCKTIISMKYNL